MSFIKRFEGKILLKLLSVVVAGVIFSYSGSAFALSVNGVIPPNGSITVGPCGPFGIVVSGAPFDPDTNYTDVILLRGSITGFRREGINWIYGDTLFFQPYVPMAPGEKVEVMVPKDHLPVLDKSYVWTCRIKAEQAAMPYSSSFSLDQFSYGTDLTFVDWDWGDLNGDLIADAVLLVKKSGKYKLMTLEHHINILAPLTLEPALGNAWSVRVVDLNRNKSMDVAVVGLDSLSIYLDPGTKSSPKYDGALRYSLGGIAGGDLATGDLNGDGYEDIIVINYFGRNVKVFMNDGFGNITPIVSSIEEADRVANWMQQVNKKPKLPHDIGDLDNDGVLDLIYGSEFQNPYLYPVRFHQGLGDGSFENACEVESFELYPHGAFIAKVFSSDQVKPPEALLPIPSNNPLRRWFYAFKKTVGCSFAMTDSIMLPGLTSTSGECVLSNSFADNLIDTLSDYPELLYCDPEAGSLFLREISASMFETVLINEPGIEHVFAGDLDLDLDGDIAIVKPGENTIILMSKNGGTPVGEPPGPEKYPCGSTIDFGVVEAKCPSDSQPIVLVVKNSGVKPAAVRANITFSDPPGCFSVGEFDTSFFSPACAGGLGVVEIPITFKAPDRVACTGGLHVEIEWKGGGEGGSDSTIVCDFPLEGQGGIYQGGVDGRDFLRLRWTPNGGSDYSLSVDSVNFGDIPKPKVIAGCQLLFQTLTFKNTGDFTMVVTAPGSTLVKAPFTLTRLIPAPSGSDALYLDPGQISQWKLSVNPMLVPVGGQYSLQLPWSVEETPGQHSRCLDKRTVTQSVTVNLIDVNPCMRLVDCSSQSTLDSCPSKLAVYPCSGDTTWKLCLQLDGWDWDEANPKVRVYHPSLPWVQWIYDPVTMVVRLFSDANNPVTTDQELIAVHAEDSLFACVSSSITINVSPNKPLAFLGMESDSGWATTTGCGCKDVTQLKMIARCLEEGGTGVASFKLDWESLDQVNLRYLQEPSNCSDTLDVTWTFDPIDSLARLEVSAAPNSGICWGDCEYTLTLIAEDLNCHAADRVEATIRVIPELPDLAVKSVECEAKVLRSVEPFNIDVTVSDSLISADSVIVKLSGDQCGCEISPDSVIIGSLAQDSTEVVTFSVFGCNIGAGIDCSIPVDCLFDASVFSIRGSDYDHNPSNNRMAHVCSIYPDCVPDIVFSTPVLNPDSQDLSKCESGPITCNDISVDNPSFCLIEGTSLDVDVSCVDADGDSVRLEITRLPTWADKQRIDNAKIHLTLHPNSGLSAGECCRLFQDAIEFVGTEVHADSSLPKVQKTEHSDVHVKCDCPDLVSWVTTPKDGDVVHINDAISIEGCISAHDSDAEDIVVSVTIDLNGSHELSETTTIPLLEKDQTICIGDPYLFPDGIEYVPEHSGRLCINLEASGPTDCDPTNNKSTVCLTVEPGPFIVRPNAITPNNDQKNDFAYFHFDNQDLVSPVVKIFSLSGRLVFESSKIDQQERIAWDGRNRSGKLVSPGAYVYVVYDGSKKFASGEIGVVR